MASDLNTSPGAAIRHRALNAWISRCASGRFSQVVPSRFQVNATASSRSTSTPVLARNSISAAIARNTSGLAYLRSHWKLLNVVHTQRCIPWCQVKLPRRVAGKISRSVRSYWSGTVRSS